MRRGRAAGEAPIRLGEKGLALLTYTGGMASIRVRGAVTCQRYRFGQARRAGYVDVRDAGVLTVSGHFRRA